MHRILKLAGATLIAAMLAACSPGINNGFAHRITFDANGMVVHASGHPNAHISRNGDLSIDGKAIAVTPAQRQLLQRYYQEARATMDSGADVGRQGVKMAERGVGDAIASIFGKDSSTADKQMDAQSTRVENAASTLCASIKTLGATQTAIATSIPAFAPYAAGDRMDCKITHTVTVRNNNGTTTTASTSSFAVSGGSDDAYTRVASAKAHSAPASEASHQP